MCGILGYSGEKPADNTDIKILYLYSETRGTHATGYATVDALEKSNNRASYFIAKNKIPSSDLIIGHTRNPSHNTKKTETNAQPFGFEKFVGVHNGYFRDSYKIRNKFDISYDLSDSYVFFHQMMETSFEEALNDVDSTSTFALAWINKEDKTLHLFRDTKPTFIGQKNGGIYFASEEDFLKSIDCVNIERTKNRHHYIIKDGAIQSETHIPMPKTTKTHNSGNHKQIKGFENDNDYGGTENTYSNLPKIGALNAPKDAHSIFINGQKVYYWLEKNIAKVEVCISYKNSEVKEYNLANKHEGQKLGREYKRILIEINELLGK